jgi:dipeptidyl aminopeptidase/acylaminoacyl peptidase
MKVGTPGGPAIRRTGVGCALLGVAAFSGVLEAQVTADTYQRAEQFLGRNARNLVTNDQVAPVWLGSNRFWYRNRTAEGGEFILVDASASSRTPAFDHARLAAALSTAADTAYEPFKLPFQRFDFLDGGRSVRFAVQDSIRWTCSISGEYACTGPDTIPDPPRSEMPSPDGRWVAFVREHNLWVRAVESGEEVQLSTDGEAFYGYAVNDQCCSQVTAPRRGQERPPVLRWSPDSRRIATHKLDQRGVEELHLLETGTGRPVLHTYRYGLPGDSVIPTFDLYVFDVASRNNVKIDLPSQDGSNTSCCGVMADTSWKDVHWGSNGDELFFTYGQRDYKRLDLMVADASTGAARRVLREESPTFIEARLQGGRPNWRPVNQNREVIWFSERDGWGHLYLYDIDGTLRNQITSGPWGVLDIVHVDDQARTIYFTGLGREADRDPYFRHLYSVGFDGSGLQLLTSADADHDIRVSPSGQYFVDTYSRRDTIPTAVVRDARGQILQTLEVGDVSQLLAAGWRFPTPFRVKARDGVTNLHGFLYFPSHFDSTKTYPVIDYIYPGPQVGPIGARGFRVNPAGNGHALAELGFIVFTIDALGTPLRSKAFHDSYFGNMGDNGIPDHIVAMRQLARRYPQMDLDRVGIFGHSGGGFSSTDAILRYPNFFKVAVSSAGNHDNRSYDYTWGEKYQGLLVPDENGGDNFDSQANQNLAANLRGKLLLLYGTLDDNVHPNATLLVIDALIEHNKDFDLIVMPNRNHGYSNEPYVIRRRWDYFVKHLLGEEPPREYRMQVEDAAGNR